MHNNRLIYFLNILALYFFFTGLFKTKLPKTTKSTTKHEGEYNKLVFILLDGLRIDGIVNTSKNSNYHNNFDFINNLDPKYKKICLSVSGVPTATATRVKSILTGLPSNFLNGIATFKHSYIQTDSFIEKIKHKSHFFFGDNTWTDLLPDLLQNSMTLGAYDKIRPFQTEINIINACKEAIGVYDYVLGHFVYLDHYGHEYTTNSLEVKTIMKEYNKFVEEVYEKMADDTLFCIYSDHGVNDDGSHGGAGIKELSSCCVFLSKKEIRDYKNTELESIRIKYLDTLYSSSTDWLETKDEIIKIYQNDIVPTVCVLMGLPIPYYCCGNLIFNIIGDSIMSYKNLAKQKMQSLDKKFNFIANDLESIFKINYQLSCELIEIYSGTNHLKIVFSLLLMLISMFVIFQKIEQPENYKLKYVFTMFTIIMISHSVYSFLHEDILWGFLYLTDHFSLFKLFIFIYFLFIGKFPQHDEDRFINIKKISDYKDSNMFFLLFVGFFIMYDIYTQKNIKKRYKLSNFINFKVFMILFKYFYKKQAVEIALAILPLNISMSNLALIIYPPPSLFLFYSLRKKRMEGASIERFAIQNMSLFYMGLNHDLSSINYEIPSLFSSNFNLFLSSLIMLFYFLYPRFLHYRRKIKYDYVLITTFHALMSMAMGYWFNNNFLFYFFFGGRCFFVSFYFLAENIAMLV